MQQVAAVVMGVAVLLICLWWTIGYVARRTRRR
jgi:HAMP domain-containing protein